VFTLSQSFASAILARTSLLALDGIDEGVLYRIAAAPAAAAAGFCKHCGAPLGGNGARRITVMDLPFDGRYVKLDVDAPRLVCPACGRSNDVRPKDLHPTHQMTARLVAHIEREGLERPYAEIEREVGVGQATIAKVVGAEIARRNAAYRPTAPAVLMIDEVHIVKGRDYAVLSDHDTVLVIEMLKDTKLKTVISGLRRLRRRKRCRVVTMDMCRRYRDAVRAVLPHALIVIDKRHVLDMARRNLVTVIGEQYRRMTPACAMDLMTLKGLMIKHHGQLKPGEPERLSAELAKSPYLRDAYVTKEAFYRLYAAPSLQAAEQHLDAWLCSLSRGMRCAYEELVTALGNWRDEILNYWRTPQRVTNGPAEGLNAVIKRINARGGGGMPFELLRARVVFGEPQRRAREASRKAARRTRRTRRQAAAPDAGA
jgi:transposase